MNVREHLLALNDELKRLKGEGSRAVSVSDGSLAGLRAAVEHARAEVAALNGGAAANVATESIATPAPVVERATSVSEPASAPFVLPVPPPAPVWGESSIWADWGIPTNGCRSTSAAGRRRAMCCGPIIPRWSSFEPRS